MGRRVTKPQQITWFLVALLLGGLITTGANLAKDASLLDEYPRTKVEYLERDRAVLVGRVLDLERDKAELQADVERLRAQLAATIQ